MIPKILGTAKIVPAKAKESANTKPRSQLSFCQLNFTKISSFLTFHATLTSQRMQHKETQHKKQQRNRSTNMHVKQEEMTRSRHNQHNKNNDHPLEQLGAAPEELSCHQQGKFKHDGVHKRPCAHHDS
jgi:hypothetical protein